MFEDDQPRCCQHHSQIDDRRCFAIEKVRQKGKNSARNDGTQRHTTRDEDNDDKNREHNQNRPRGESNNSSYPSRDSLSPSKPPPDREYMAQDREQRRQRGGKAHIESV